MTYSSEVLADSPLAYWRLGESSGTSAVDETGNGRTGTYNNTPTLGVAGAIGGDADTAVSFASGSSEDVTVAHWAGLDVSTFTLEVWVKGTSTNRAIIGRQGHTSVPYSMFVAAGGQVMVVIKTSGTSGTNYTGTTTINDGNWHHVVVTRETAASNALKIYVDGVLDYSTTGAASPNVGTTFGFAVASRGGSAYYDGTVDEAAFYNTALSAARVTAHYVAGTPIVGTLNATLPLPVAEFAGTYDGPIVGTLAATLPLPVADFAGAYTPPPSISGTLAAVLPFPEVSFVGHYMGPVGTDTSNAFDGRDRGGRAVVTMTIPVTESPYPTPPPRVDVAIPYPEPVIVKGRPT